MTMTLLAGMTEIPYLTEIVVILGLSVIVIYLFQRLNMPSVLGFLATGVLFGPHALGFVDSGEEIQILSEIGVVLLLFIIGLEFSLKSLVSIKKIVLLGGGVQVGLTILLTAAVAYFLGFAVNTSVFIGFLLALSSTAIVLKLLQDNGMMRTPHGRIALGILIFQDVIVVPMMLLVPLLAGQGGNVTIALLTLLVKVVLVIGLVYISARHLVPRLLHEIAHTRSRELFLITIMVICFAVAYLTSMLGLSLALGAFMAGLCISESEYSHQATGLIIPFREIFTSFFFVSIGMLLDMRFVLNHILLVSLFTLGAIVLKSMVLFIAVYALKYPLKTGALVGFTLFQVGEFAFILSQTGLDYGLLSQQTYQYFLSVSILTMGITPLLIARGDKLAGMLMRTAFGKLPHYKAQEPDLVDVDELKSHLVIIGYGTNGHNAALTAKKAGIPYVIVDADAQVVQDAKAMGEPIVFGDAQNHHILHHVHIFNARVAIVAVPDFELSQAIVAGIRDICRTVHIVVRAKTVLQVEELLHAGASEAISEEFEASVEVFARMLNQFLVSPTEIDDYIEVVRDQAYSGIHSSYHVYKKNAIELTALRTIRLTLAPESLLTGQHLCEAKILDGNKVRLAAIVRKEKLINELNGDTLMLEGDEVLIAGLPVDLNNFQLEWNDSVKVI